MAAVLPSLQTAGHYAFHGAKTAIKCAPGVSDTPLLCTIRSLWPKYLYDSTKYSTEFVGSWAYWGGKQFTSLCDEIVRSIGLRDINLYHNVAKITHQLGATINHADQLIVTSVAPELQNTSEILNDEAFKVRDLIGPTLFISYCAQQTIKNGLNAKRHLSMLWQGKFSETTRYQPSTSQSVSFEHTTTYTRNRLTRLAMFESLSTAVWAAGGYLAKVGITDVLEENGVEASKAQLIANTVALSAIAIPKLMTLAYTKLVKPVCYSITQWQHATPTNDQNDPQNMETREKVVYGIDKYGNLTKTLIQVPISPNSTAPAASKA